MDFIQNTFDGLIDKNGNRSKIQHGWSSSEKRLGKFFVDGYARVDEKNFIFEYDGCVYHECKKCDREALFKRDETQRTAFLKNLPHTVIIRITECEWLEKMKTLSYTPKISPILFKKKVHPEEMLKLLTDKKLYGFLVVDIEATEKAQKFLDINWPPILKKAMVEYDDIPKWMQKNVKATDFPKEQIVQAMNGKEILLHTCLLEFYLENGFKVVKIHKFLEYEGNPCFKNVYKTVYEARVEATQMKMEKDATPEMKNAAEMKATAVKLVSNSMYGAMLQVPNFIPIFRFIPIFIPIFDTYFDLCLESSKIHNIDDNH